MMGLPTLQAERKHLTIITVMLTTLSHHMQRMYGYGDLAPYPVEGASELTEYEEALRKSWLFYRPASMTNSAQERPQQGAPHVTAAHSGARPKKSTHDVL